METIKQSPKIKPINLFMVNTNQKGLLVRERIKKELFNLKDKKL